MFKNLLFKERFDILLGVIQVVVIIITIILAYKAYQQTNNIFVSQNRPNIIVTENQFGNCVHLMLWNMGPGVAYDITVETHFADIHGNIGLSFIKEVIVSAIELETKSEDELFKNSHSSILGTTNPPNTLPVGLEYGYKTSPLVYHPLPGLIIIIRYKDNIGVSYYSYWNGYNWIHSSGNFKTPILKYPYLYPSNPVSLFIEMLNKSDTIYSSGYYKIKSRLSKEAMYLDGN